MDRELYQIPVQAIGKAQVDIAQLQIEVVHLTEKVQELRDSNAQITQQLNEISKLLNEARGGWRVMMMMGGAGVTLGGAIVWVLQHIKVTP